MKNRAFAITMVVVGVCFASRLVWADATLQPKNPKNAPFEGSGGRDISQNPLESWQAPVGTVDPSRLMPAESMSSNGISPNGLGATKSDSVQLAKAFTPGTPIQIEQSQTIPKAENANSTPAEVIATATPKGKSNSKRIITIGLICVAILAYRKFRRAHAGRYPPKPNFL